MCYSSSMDVNENQSGKNHWNCFCEVPRRERYPVVLRPFCTKNIVLSPCQIIYPFLHAAGDPLVVAASTMVAVAVVVVVAVGVEGVDEQAAVAGDGDGVGGRQAKET